MVKVRPAATLQVKGAGDDDEMVAVMILRASGEPERPCAEIQNPEYYLQYSRLTGLGL